MKRLYARTLLTLLCCGLLSSALAAAETGIGVEIDPGPYVHGPDSERHGGVPRGTVTQHIFRSKIFAGTIREYWVYVPAQYDAAKPAALMVFQDGGTFVNEERDYRVPIVFDNLIHQGAMPVTIALMINPGHKGDAPPVRPVRPSNRSFEYDTLSDGYVRFLIEEIIPAVGAEYNLTDDPKLRAICGNSSGGICSFTAAWERPDYFHRVLSHIGSFTNIRGGHVYPALIRKGDIRGIKVFLQDGANDLDNAHGSWWLGNLQMEKALKYRDYDYKFVAGEEGHNGKHGGPIFPESLKWLWSDVAPK